ncbi:putative membrane protein YhhN [Arcicella aurantiaca]|uniref:Putative membrane protein YhhN n=1 Tax=Arcicella aurantiaca TaxID=591202 RepID=A0A316EDV9_9BACT|nr:lysoplasmalogenase [Arcicella aurantiaca]PWK26841.1 putative membrane protein YhhN [Arcicella aurantiaca]
MKTKTFTYIFAIISILEIIAGTIGFREGVFFTKPLIMLSIILFYYLKAQKPLEKQDVLMLMAFTFSWLGDVFLMFSGETFFMLGLGSFLMTHLFYIYVFSRTKKDANISARIFIPILSISLFALIYPHVNKELLIPVLVYMLAICVMAICASERKTTTESFRFVFVGAMLFVLSDSFLAIEKFAYKIPASTFLVMGTYVMAQYFIAIGFLKQSLKA